MQLIQYIYLHIISILKIIKPKLCCSLDDRLDFCTVCHMLDSLLMDEISNSLKIFVKNACRAVTSI